MTVIPLKVRCPKCQDGILYSAPCPYCAAEGFVEAKVACAIRETSRAVFALWCDCPNPAEEVFIGRGGIFCAACEKQVQEEWGFA